MTEAEKPEASSLCLVEGCDQPSLPLVPTKYAASAGPATPTESKDTTKKITVNLLPSESEEPLMPFRLSRRPP